MLWVMASLYPLTLTGLFAGALALILRRQEVRYPARGDIRAKGGLDHMLVGVMAGLALVSIGTASVVMVGIVVPAALAVIALVADRMVDLRGMLAPLYPFQLTLAVIALICALCLWIAVIALTQGGSYV